MRPHSITQLNLFDEAPLPFVLAAHSPRKRITKEMQGALQAHFQAMLVEHGIRVRRWRRSMSGCAYRLRREIEIPKVTSVQTFGVAMHEIRHILQGEELKGYLAEFDAERFAIGEIERFGLSAETYVACAKGYVLSAMVKAHNRRRLAKAKIPLEVREWLGGILAEARFEEWTPTVRVRALWGFNWKLMRIHLVPR